MLVYPRIAWRLVLRPAGRCTVVVCHTNASFVIQDSHTVCGAITTRTLSTTPDQPERSCSLPVSRPSRSDRGRCSGFPASCRYAPRGQRRRLSRDRRLRSRTCTSTVIVACVSAFALRRNSAKAFRPVYSPAKMPPPATWYRQSSETSAVMVS